MRKLKITLTDNTELDYSGDGGRDREFIIKIQKEGLSISGSFEEYTDGGGSLYGLEKIGRIELLYEK